MCVGAPLVGLGVAVVAVAVSLVVMFRTDPPLSPRLVNWRNRGKFLHYNGHSIFYMDVEGSGEGGTLVCLHGFPTFSWDWSKVLPGLQSHFSRVLLLDYLGFGLSDKPSNHSYSIFEQADIVTHLASHLSVNHAHLLSHDYGDTVALELLARHNVGREGEKGGAAYLSLQSLTMLNGGVFPETNIPRPTQKLLLVPVLGPILSRLTFFGIFKIGFGEVFGANKPTEDDYTDFYAGISHNSGHLVTASLLQYLPERAVNKDRWVGALKNSRIPVLMIYGPDDPVNPPQFADHFRKEVPGQKLVVLEDNISHYPQWESPDTVLTHMLQFVRQLPATSSES